MSKLVVEAFILAFRILYFYFPLPPVCSYLSLIQPSTHVSPNLWQPRDGPQFMKNDLANVRPEESIGCFTISKNGAYLISTSGGLITLFNMSTFKVTLRCSIIMSSVADCL